MAHLSLKRTPSYKMLFSKHQHLETVVKRKIRGLFVLHWLHLFGGLVVVRLNWLGRVIVCNLKYAPHICYRHQYG